MNAASAWLPRLVWCVLWILVGSLWTTSSYGQQYPFRTYTLDHGLPQSQPTTLLQSRSGHLWVGTNGGGLASFDGRAFVSYDQEDGLPSSTLTALLETSDGTLWVGTDRGLVRRRGAGFEPAFPDAESFNVASLVEDRQGRLWIGTDEDGLFRYDGEQLTAYTDAHGLVENAVLDLALDADGEPWVGTLGGLCHLDDPDAEAPRFACVTKEDGLPSNAVLHLVLDSNGAHWVGTASGLAVYDGAAVTTIDAPGLGRPYVQALALDHQGAFWIGTDTGLVRLQDGRATTFTKRNGLGDDSIFALLEDREGNLWVGTDGGGLSQYTRSPFVLFSSAHGLSHDITWSFAEDAQGRLWAGSQNGISRYDGEAFTVFGTDDGLPGETVYATLVDRRGRLWAGTSLGPAYFDGRRFRRAPGLDVQAPVWSMYEDREGRLWLGTAYDGLYRYDGTKATHFGPDEGLPGYTVSIFLEDAAGGLWIGTQDGLAYFDGQRFQRLTRDDGLSHNEITSLAQDRRGRVWAGTYGGGVNVVAAADGRLRHLQTLTESDGLSDNAILASTSDADGALWLCTNNGLTRVDVDAFAADGTLPDDDEPGARLRTYGLDDGFVGRECNSGAAFRGRDGTLWFGTVKGVMRYRADQERTNLLEPLTHITGVRLFFEPLPQRRATAADTATAGPGGRALPAGLRLQHDENHVTFDFAAVSLSAPDQVRYQYRLDGLDRAWTPPTEDRHATYANLAPGDYTFEVRASNGDGVWNAEPVAYAFSVARPFWQTWWFLAVGLGMGVTAVFTVVRTRERMHEQRRSNLEALVHRRTQEVRAEKEKAVAANERLREANVELEQLSLVARETDNVVAIADADGRLEWINEGYSRLTGLGLDDLRAHYGHHLADISTAEDIERLIDEAVRQRRSVIYESTYRHDDGRLAWFTSTLTPIFDAEGRPKKLVVIDTDTTERKQLERELINAREAALEAARVKSEFLANMSHEIRTPMNGVIGMTSLLLDTPLSTQQTEFVHIIRKSGEALLDIINEILDFSKIEAGRIDLEELPFEVHDVVEESLDLVVPRASEKGLELAYFIDGDVPAAVASDLTRVRQILTNLLSNAVKFTQEGEVTVHVRAEGAGEGRTRLHFTVTDTGIGIPEDRRAQLFDSFTQVDASTTRKYGGTGLGLAISKRLSELLGGTMWVESVLDQGSSFHFTIEARVVPSMGRRSAAHRPRVLRDRRVLIVDDNETNRRMLTLQTEAWGMRPRVAASGAEALAWLDRGDPFDVALLDMQMPEMDGLTLAAEIAERRPADQLPLVMLSSIGYRPQRDDDAHLFAWLTKPAKQAQLLNTLLRALAIDEEATPAGEAEAGEGALGQRHPLRILLAEDNLINQKVATRILARMGYDADVVADGREVLDALARRSYDVVLMDVQMPEMDGLEATQEIHARLPAATRPHIIAMTANAMTQDRTRCLEAGMDDYLSKPVRVDALAAALGRCTRLAETPAPSDDTAYEVPDRFSLGRLRRMVGDDDAFLHDMIRSFRTDTPRAVRQLADAVARGDASTVQLVAHTLKSSSQMFGAVALAHLCAQLEELGERGALDEAEALLPAAEAEIDEVVRAVEAFLGAPA